MHQNWDPFPYPRSPIRDKEDVIRLSDLEALQVGAQQREHGIWSLKRGVTAGGKASLTFAFRIDHIDDQHLWCTPRSGIALTPFLGLEASFGLTQATASAITADHHPTPRYGVLKHCALNLLHQPGPCRVAIGNRPYRFGV